jgi:hypothetical protein
MIKAPRRYGKTSLILESLKNEKFIYIDIRRVPRVDIIPNEIVEKAYEIGGVFGIVSKIKENVVRFLSNVKLDLKIDYKIIQASAEYLSSDEKTTPCQDLIFALKTVDNIGRSLNKTITIVFDEFQDIKKFSCDNSDILELLRGELQHLKYIHSIFLGSIETIMNEIFENKKSPFFNYCRKLKLEAFEIDELSKELIEAFTIKEVTFENNSSFKSLLEKLSGHPANTMIVMQNLYYISLENNIKKITEMELNRAFENGYYEMLDLVEQYIIEIKNKKHYHDVLYNMANNSKQTLSPQALHQVRTGLLNMGYLQKMDKGEYKIIDNFLLYYLKVHY